MDRPRNSEPQDHRTAYERRFFRDETKEEAAVKKSPENPNDEDTKDKKPKAEPEVKKEDKKEKGNKKESKKKPLTPEEKQEKRVEVVERCQTYKKQFEDTPIPRDPTTVARLIVAEHILTLNEELQQPEAAKKPTVKKELEEALDYMCLLAEKFEDPSVEYPPEIEDTYENLVVLAAKALHEGSQPERLVEDSTQATNDSAENPIHVAEAEKAINTPAAAQNEVPGSTTTTAAIVSLLAKGKDTPGRPITATPPTTTPQAHSLHSGSGGFISKPSLHSSPGPHPTQVYKKDGFTSASNRARYPAAELHQSPETIGRQPEVGQPKTAIYPLAAVALASVVATKIHKSPEISHRHEHESPINHKGSHEVSSSQSKSHHESTNALRYWNELHSPSTTAAAPSSEKPLIPKSYEPGTVHRSESPIPTSNRKLEHMTLQSLLALAHNVPIGHGRYLKTEFEHGRIDKAGLIKVLKAKKKGLDFFREYKKQSADFQLRRISPEFLTHRRAMLENNDSKSSNTAPAPQEKSELATSEKPPVTHPLLERFNHPEKSLWQAAPKNNTRLQVIIAIIATIIFTFITLSFFTAS